MERNKTIVKTSIIGIIVNIFLVLFKSIIGLSVNSIAIILDAINNLTDVLSSVITIIGTKLASKLPDKEHPYGHGRIEYIASILIAILVLYAGVIALKESIAKIINKEISNYSIISIIFVIMAIFVKLFLSIYVKKKGKEVNSQSLLASAQDAFMDSLLSVAIFIAVIINYIFSINIEGYLGIVISIFIIRTSLYMFSDSINLILGQRVDSNFSKKIKNKILKFDEVQGVYDLNLHNYGPANIIGSAHIQVRDDMTADEIHILTRNIAYKIYLEFGITLTIGIYAANDKGESGEIKKELDKIVKQYKEILQVHGFYVDNVNSNIFFDLIIDFSILDKEQIKNEVILKLKEKYPNYNCNVVLDLDITD